VARREGVATAFDGVLTRDWNGPEETVEEVLVDEVEVDALLDTKAPDLLARNLFRRSLLWDRLAPEWWICGLAFSLLLPREEAE
jgi:hypothetical protein